MSRPDPSWRDLRRHLRSIPLKEILLEPIGTPEGPYTFRFSATLTDYVSVDRLKKLQMLLGPDALLGIVIKDGKAILNATLRR